MSETIKSLSNIKQSKRYIFFWNMTRWASLYSPLSKTLKEKYNIDTIIFTYGKASLPNKELFGFDTNDFVEVIDVEPYMIPRPNHTIPSAKEISNLATKLKERCGVNLLDILRTDRHLGINFVTGANFMRSKFGINHSYMQSMDTLLRLCEDFEHLLSKYQPIAIIAWPGSIGPAALVGVAEGMGIPMRSLLISRFGKNFHWVTDRFATPYGIEESYNKYFNNKNAFNSNILEPIQTAAPERTKRVLDNFEYRSSFIFLFTSVYRKLRMMLGNYVYGRKKIYGNYLFSDWLKLFIERWYWRRRVLKENSVISDLQKDLPFIFFPLHIEPESTMMVEAQMCDNQLSLLDWVVKSVPAGWFVVVKEHPGATAPRPPGFWWRVKKYPNVILAATLEDSSDILEKAKAVASINGTVGVQSALNGLPVISFHPRFIANCLPHVLVANSYDTTREAIKRIENNDLPDLDTRLHSARAFSEGLSDCTFPMDHKGLQLGIPDEASIPQSEVDRGAETLLLSLGFSHNV